MIDKILLEKLKSNFNEAYWFIKTNKVRTFLTALGIIFGVASVITMLAIGNGAEKEILAQLELVGVNNIVVTPLPDKEDTESNGEEKDEESSNNSKTKRFSKGLDILDAESIKTNIPSVNLVSPEIILDTYVINDGKQNSVKLIGVSSSFFESSNISIEKGKVFTDYQLKNALPVCIIGKKVEKKLFTGESALGRQIKVKDVWLQVVGIIEEKLISDQAQENLGIRDLNQDVYIPIKTFLVRYKDRKIISDKQAASGDGFVVVSGQQNGPKKRIPRGNYHQIDKLTVQVSNSNELKSTAEVLSKMLKRRHNDVLDFEITIPIQLLKQQQKTKQIFNIVLSIIAGISLLIGGIGIMNIMLASVLERTKEIGIIRAIGATEEDVILQFLSESVLISVGGGIIGIIVGVIGAYIIEIVSGIETVLSINSILLSFFIAVIVGLVFGIFPAKAAAKKRPIEALRSE
jgi:putative ABC transport system permease protein